MGLIRHFAAAANENTMRERGARERDGKNAIIVSGLWRLYGRACLVKAMVNSLSDSSVSDGAVNKAWTLLRDVAFPNLVSYTQKIPPRVDR